MNFPKNQYLITSEECATIFSSNVRSTTWAKLHIYADSNLGYETAGNDYLEILFLGFIFDPLKPNFTNRQIVQNLAINSCSIDSLLHETQKLSGRYIFLAKSKDSFIAFTDACGLRQIFLFAERETLALSSSAKLILDSLKLKLNVNENILNILNDPDYKRKEMPWYGENWYDNRIRKILPNHYYDLLNKQIKRVPYYYDGPESEAEILEYVTSLLKGSMDAVHARYKVIQPLTAGWDSRILLAASKKHISGTKYYIFARNQSDLVANDVVIASKIATKFKLNFEVITPPAVDEKFINVFKENCYFPRILPKTANIQWHYYNNNNQNIININGNGGEVARCYYNNEGSSRHIDIDQLNKLVDINTQFKDPLQKWHSDANFFSEESGISILDLFYWEQRMGNWGAQFPYEQDIAIEEFSPFNNKNLLYSLLKINYKLRHNPDYRFFKKLINNLWADTLVQPINPINGLNIKKRLRIFKTRLKLFF